MERILYTLTFMLIVSFVVAQDGGDSKDTSWKTDYRESSERINDLVNTKLDAKFDYNKSYLNGKVWITLQPHFYPTDSLSLDAKGMDIHKIQIVSQGKDIPLKYDYNGSILRIKLDKKYKGAEKYTVFIDYTAKPEEIKAEGSAAITDAKGLYFINPKGDEPNKPTQIWTQGETESNSVWLPTIDKPNQKSTEEISMTVPSKYVTLSNGLLVSQKNNGDGTRTDTWKLDLPHAPYLFFMGVGEYAIVKDSYKGKEVSYYVEKEYAPVARKIFGLTPEMIAFYSRITGVDFPWPKYGQIVGRDYVSGAMENTTATLHQESAQQDSRQLVDGNSWEDVVSHELFHQWFGDLVTTESWSNITLNESFADYSEYLWREYKYGRDHADAHHYQAMQNYIRSGSDNKDLVRFYYHDKEDVFDAVSYNKGGRILNMLRHTVGDSAFFKALHLYLTTNKFKSAEAHNLRLAMEEVSGKDLNWFFNQWYFGSGHPKLDINYSYDDASKKVIVVVTQNQTSGKIFKLPVAIDIYNGPNKTRYNVWVDHKTDSFSFNSSSKPDLVNFDGDKYLLAEKKENKTLENYIHQYKYAGLYIDRREAIDFASKKQDDNDAVQLLKSALHDKYFGLRLYTLERLDMKKSGVKSTVEHDIYQIAMHDEKPLVRAKAVNLLATYNNPEYKTVFEKAINDSSYSISGEALAALGKIDSVEGFKQAQKLAKYPAKGKLADAISENLIKFGDENAFDIIAKNFDQLPLGQAKFETLQPFANFLAKVNNEKNFKNGVDMIVAFREIVPKAFRQQTDPFINNMVLKGLANKKQSAGQKDLADYVNSKITEKKGF